MNETHGVVVVEKRGDRLVCTFASSLMTEAQATELAAKDASYQIVSAGTLRMWKREMVNGGRGE